MAHARQLNVSERVADLATAEPYERALLTLRGYTTALLDTGYPRDELYRDFARVRGVLERREAPEEAEDTVLDVMDFLTGFSSSFIKLKKSFSVYRDHYWPPKASLRSGAGSRRSASARRSSRSTTAAAWSSTLPPAAT